MAVLMESKDLKSIRLIKADNTLLKFTANCLHLLFMALILALTLGCQNSVDTVIEDYNSSFELEIPEDPHPGPGEPGFNQNDLLLDKYFISSTETLNLAGPANCNYEWTFTNIDPSDNKKNFAKLVNGSSYTSRRFVMYIPLSEISEGSYRLRLSITDKEGNRYTDNCILYIYKDFSQS